MFDDQKGNTDYKHAKSRCVDLKSDPPENFRKCSKKQIEGTFKCSFVFWKELLNNRRGCMCFIFDVQKMFT